MEKASRALAVLRLFLFPFVGSFILIITAIDLAIAPFIAVYYVFRRFRQGAFFSLPAFFVQQASNWLSFSLLLSDSRPPQAANARIVCVPTVSGFELFFRPLFAIMFLFNEIIFAFFCSMALFMQFFHILIFGKRRLGLHLFIEQFWLYFLEGGAYLLLGTDERPPLIPPTIRSENWHKLLE